MSKPRKPKGRPISGWLILDKPVDFGSTEAVSKIKWLYKAQKAGHAGTLDPLASGMLPIALGDATKTVPYVMDGRKIYEFTVSWGEERATDDLEGEVTESSDKRPSEQQIRDILPRYIGTISQVPPQFSAIKISGERAYDLARDFGRELGCYGHVSGLRRTFVAPFAEEAMVPLADLVALEAIEDMDERLAALDALLIDTCEALSALPHLVINDDQAHRLKMGNPILVRGRDAPVAESEAYATARGRLIAIGEIGQGEFRPKRVFA